MASDVGLRASLSHELAEALCSPWHHAIPQHKLAHNVPALIPRPSAY